MKMLWNYVDDVLVLAGCGCILYGVWQVLPEAIWFVFGGMLIGWGVLLGRYAAR